MNILRNKLIKGRTLTIEEDLTFPIEQYAATLVKEIKNCHVIANINAYDDDIIEVHFDVKTLLVVEDAYTLKPLEYKQSFEDELTFISANDGVTEGILAPHNQIDLDKYVLQGIIADLPLRIVKKGSKLPQSGKNYRVLTEDEFVKEKKSSGDPRLSALDNVSFEDD
jgi:uncharacterized protein